ncbi:MarR family transcriptional regulator [Streptomyces sp. MS2A]|nr:MarR family transcriptional regulator [Streptomyces sp. MS2A]
MTSPETALLSALTRLSVHWGSARTQAEVAAVAGVRIDPADIPPLYVLGIEGPRRAGELATVLRLTRPTMTKQVDRLERAGLVERIADLDDARARVVRLTDEGRGIHAALVAQGLAMMSDALAEWPADDAARFAADLTRFVRALGVPGNARPAVSPTPRPEDTGSDMHARKDTDEPTRRDPAAGGEQRPARPREGGHP